MRVFSILFPSVKVGRVVVGLEGLVERGSLNLQGVGWPVWAVSSPGLSPPLPSSGVGAPVFPFCSCTCFLRVSFCSPHFASPEA